MTRPEDRPEADRPATGAPEPADHMAASPVTGRGYLSGPGLHQLPVEYAVVDGHAVYQGCIDMGPVEEIEEETARIDAEHAVDITTVAAGADPAANGDPTSGIGLPTTSRFLWPNGRVAWAVDAAVPDQQRIPDAIGHLEQSTGIRFVRRTAGNARALPNWIQVVSNGSSRSSSSPIGMRGGRQDLRLADAHPWPVLVHEFLHALGVYHEQSRSDRDTWVEVKWDNIQDGPPPAGEPNALHNFQKQPGATDYFDYDYSSLMHYGPRSFAKDSSKPTLVPKRSGVTIGQRSGMSFGDRQTVAKMYERFFEKGWSGVWRGGTGAHALWANADWAGFRDRWQQWSGQGLRLVDLHVRATSAGARYTGVFLPGSGGHALWAGASWDSFRAKWQELSAQGLRLHDLHIHTEGGQDRYSGVFLPGSGGHALWVGADWDTFHTRWQQWSAQGLRLHGLHVRQVGGRDRFSGVFLPGSGGHALWAGADWGSFVAKWRELSAQGLRLVDLSSHRAGTAVRWSGAFLPGNDPHVLWANVTWESFRAKWDELAGKGLRLVDADFVNPPAGALSAGVEVGDLDLPEELAEPFGGVVEAVVPAQRAADAMLAADGDGGAVLEEASGQFLAQLDGEGDGGIVLDVRTPAERDQAAGQGAAELPEAVPAGH